MFGMFPFMFNNNQNNRSNMNNINPFLNLLNDDFLNSVVDQMINSDFVNEMINEINESNDYDVELKDYGEYYLIRGYLPGLGPKDVSIDFEKNKAILTIKKKKQTYRSGNNMVMTVVQGGADLVKTFYISEVDVTKLRASFDDSLLLLTLPKIRRLQGKYEDTSEATIIDVDSYKVE